MSHDMTAPDDRIPEPDWSAFYGEPNSNRCSCGVEFLSFHKLVLVASRAVGITQEPCPGCGSRTSVVRSSSPPESWSLQ